MEQEESNNNHNRPSGQKNSDKVFASGNWQNKVSYEHQMADKLQKRQYSSQLKVQEYQQKLQQRKTTCEKKRKQERSDKEQEESERKIDFLQEVTFDASGEEDTFYNVEDPSEETSWNREASPKEELQKKIFQEKQRLRYQTRKKQYQETQKKYEYAEKTAAQQVALNTLTFAGRIAENAVQNSEDEQREESIIRNGSGIAAQVLQKDGISEQGLFRYSEKLRERDRKQPESFYERAKQKEKQHYFDVTSKETGFSKKLRSEQTEQEGNEEEIVADDSANEETQKERNVQEADRQQERLQNRLERETKESQKKAREESSRTEKAQRVKSMREKKQKQKEREQFLNEQKQRERRYETMRETMELAKKRNLVFVKKTSEVSKPFLGAMISIMVMFVILYSLVSCLATMAVGSFGNSFSNTVIAGTTYVSDLSSIEMADAYFYQKYKALKQEEAELKAAPDHDYTEVTGVLTYNHFDLISYLTARYGNWSYDSSMESILDSIFSEMFQMSHDIQTKTRRRNVFDADSGTWTVEEFEAEVLCITYTIKDFYTMALENLSEEEFVYYQNLNSIEGGLQSFSAPAENWRRSIKTYYDSSNGYLHTATFSGFDVKAMETGTITAVGPDLVYVECENGMAYQLSGLSRVFVSVGELVSRDAVIGITGTDLYVSVWMKGENRNPLFLVHT